MGKVRPLTDADMPGVVRLYERVFRSRLAGSADGVEPYLVEIFCRNPWRDETLPSLVCEEPDGRIVGCIGVVPRPMSLNGRSIWAAITHTFMVEPDRRPMLAGVSSPPRHVRQRGCGNIDGGATRKSTRNGIASCPSAINWHWTFQLSWR